MSGIPTLGFAGFSSSLPAPDYLPLPGLSRDTPLQIIFTSGTTAEPKGIVHTQGNVLASLDPLEQEIGKYLRYERFFHPLRILHTLPLSHVFGQFMGLWVPPLLAAEVHYEDRLQAPRLATLMREERISVLAAVPRVLDLLRAYMEAEFPALSQSMGAARSESVGKRWWRFRAVHRRLGFKFWAFVSGGAALPADLESFWTTAGFALIQGYGMTETTALVTLNHPFKIARGSIGKPLPGREVKIGADGEILVRGGSIAAQEWRNGRLQPRADDWLATGDLATRNDTGELVFAGRKSDVIVTSAGLNIHPQDLEAVLHRQAGLRDALIVAYDSTAGPTPAAVLIAGPDQGDEAAEARGGCRQWRACAFPANSLLAALAPGGVSPHLDRQGPAPGGAELGAAVAGGRRRCGGGSLRPAAGGAASTRSGQPGNHVQRSSHRGPAPGQPGHGATAVDP